MRHQGVPEDNSSPPICGTARHKQGSHSPTYYCAISLTRKVPGYGPPRAIHAVCRENQRYSKGVTSKTPLSRESASGQRTRFLHALRSSMNSMQQVSKRWGHLSRPARRSAD